jgi:hypothetical protein
LKLDDFKKNWDHIIRFRERPIMEVYGTSPNEVRGSLHEKEGRVLRVDEAPVGSLNEIGFRRAWRYCAAKKGVELLVA